LTDRGVRRRATAADIAQSLGVSRATVGFVLNNIPGKTSEATRRRVLDEAARLGYRPHIAAQTLARGSSRIVLFLLPDWPDDFSMRQYLDEAAHVLDSAGYSLVTFKRHASDRARPLWESLDPEIVVSTMPWAPDTLTALRRAGITNIVPDPDSPVPHDVSALAAGPRLQVEHLHALGHRRLAIASASDPRLAELSGQRARSAHDAAKRLGLGELDVRSVRYRDGSARQAVLDWHRRGVTGIVAYNDETAIAVIGAALRSGLTVPDDLAVIGHDDSPLAEMFVPSLSSVRIDTASVGRYVAQLVLHQADGRPAPVAGPDLKATVVPRESTLVTGSWCLGDRNTPVRGRAGPSDLTDDAPLGLPS